MLTQSSLLLSSTTHDHARRIMKFYQILTTAGSLIILSSCATKFTSAQRDSLNTVAVTTTTVKNDAYAPPYGGDRKNANMAGMAGVTSGTGAIGGVVGSLVGESIAATQNNLFKSKNQQHFAAVQKNTPAVGPILNTQLVNGLKQDHFFSKRIRSNSTNLITSEIHNYQLVRCGKNNNGELLLAPQIIANISLKDASGNNLSSGTYVGIGHTDLITVYATNPTKTKQGYEVASKIAVESFLKALSQKTAE